MYLIQSKFYSQFYPFKENTINIEKQNILKYPNMENTCFKTRLNYITP